MENIVTLEERVVSALMSKGWHICFAESCTAGLACARLVNVANASAVLNESFVTYANEAKVKYVGVDPLSIEKYGVVSERVALEMATGACRASDSQVGVGISGIAGPGGGSAAKPVGTVCFGFNINGGEYAVTKHFENADRQGVRQASVDFVFEFLSKKLSE